MKILPPKPITYVQHLRFCNMFGVKPRNPISFIIWKLKSLNRFAIKAKLRRTKMYKATYKCRMCGEKYVLDCTDKAWNASDVILQFINGDYGKLPYGTTMHVTEKHVCKDGSIGYADFVGFKKGK